MTAFPMRARGGRGPRSRPWSLLAVLAVAVLVNTYAVIALGARHAARLAFAAAASTGLDGLFEQRSTGALPVVDVRIDADTLRLLQRDLPWSGGTYHRAEVMDAGIRFPVKFRYRGAVMPSHYIGGKASFRLRTHKRGPFTPLRTVNLINPKSLSMVHGVAAFWAAGATGADVPFTELAFVRANGEDVGVMELVEQVDGRCDMVRGRAAHQVPVYKGDMPPLDGHSLPEGKPLWASADAWQYASKADHTRSDRTLAGVIDALHHATDSTFAQRIDTLIDRPAFARFLAAIKLLNTHHIDNIHNQWLVASARDGRLRPVLWDPVIFSATGLEPFYPINDAMAFALLRDGAFRLERDRALFRALQKVHVHRALDGFVATTLERMRPAALADRRKCAVLADGMNEVVRYSAWERAHAADAFVPAMHAYWQEVMRGFDIVDLHRSGTADVVRVEWKGAAAVRVRWRSQQAPAIESADGSTVQFVPDGRSALVMPGVVHCDGPKADAFAGDRWYNVLPVQILVRFAAGADTTLTFENAVTDGPITPR